MITLACLLLSYEADEPHGQPDDSEEYPERSQALLTEWLSSDHFGDCTNQPNTCMRCVAEQALHKAKWLTKKMKTR